MYLKSLEIQGFKSFPDKISLTFDKGLTAVVGPNGSGKSNIGDSVRWVLGEQSTKTLRGNKMEDVIFSGTVARKAMGFAAVTLNIDNSDGKLDGLGDEVSVTRKLYRSGESEYLINGKSVRLKDINELFMDTGLGRDGYSIIGQGRIAEIVGAKSSERRDIFEEAAGISKFRYRKQEAERRLAAAQDNILRLSDIISELESRVEPLKIQSQKAEKFLKLSEQKKKLEISVWVNRLEELKAKTEELDEKILVSRNEYQNLENDIRRQEQKAEDGYRKMQECTVKSDELRRKMLDEEREASEMKSSIAVFENDIKHCEAAAAAAQQSIKNALETKKKLEKQRKNAENKIAELGEERKKLADETSETSELLREAEQENSELGSNADKIGSRANSLYIKRSECRFACEAAAKAAEEEKKRLEELRNGSRDSEKLIEEYELKKSAAHKRLEELSEKEKSLINRLDGTGKLYQLRKDGFEQAKAEFERILYDLKEKQQRRKILNDLENNMDGFAGSVKQVMKASRQGRLSGVFGTVAQNIGVEPKYAAAIETALGGAVQNIIVENEESAKRCIKFLKEQNGGRATFLPVTSVKGHELKEQGLENCGGYIAMASEIVDFDMKFAGIVASLLGRTAVAEDIDSATVIAKKYGYRFRIVTLDGQVINAGGSFTGGSAQKSGGVITRKNEIDTLDGYIKNASEQQEKLKAKTDRLRAEADKLRFDAEGIKSELNECRAEKIKLESEISGLETLEKQIRGQSENSGRLIVEAEKRIAGSEKTIEEAENTLAEINLEIEKAEKEIEQSNGAREQLRMKRAELAEKLSRLRIRDTELEKDIQAQFLETGRIDGSIEELESGKRNFYEEIEEQNRIILQKRQTIGEIREKLSGFKNNSGVYLEQIKHNQEMHSEQSRIVREIQKGLKQLNDTKEKYSGEITRLEERRENLCRESDNIIKQLLEVYELTRSEAVRLAEKTDDIQAAQRELADIKNKIRALGSVNVGAVEEYKEVSERYRFMSGQLDDVKSSKTELEKIIAGLTEEMCRIFSESFNIINENFKQIFRELFGGGKAELILTEPENVLESGIEISVAPPGKVIKNLISLSGGEQSFVAIAIYFAILKLRPAPFCILDEIDAALDEANVRRYAQYLKNFTDTTQFVLVTHRRSAMEEANVLYGVTMQEDGISKLLKMEQVDFQEDAADLQQ